MGVFLVSRLAQAVITLIVVNLLVFGLARMTGSPLELLIDVSAPAEDRERLAAALGLDQPIYVQYGIFLAGLARGDLGTSLRAKQPVTELLTQRVPNTLLLVGLATALALVLAIPMGVVAATHRNGFWDALARGVALVGQSIPTFWASGVLILIFAVQLSWLPSGRKTGPESFILPVIAMALFGFMLAGAVRLLRGSMLEVLDSEFVKFARSKGLAERTVVWKHAFRNALIPLVTFAGSYFGILMGGSVVVETVFAWPGVGRLAYEAVQWRDYPLIQGVVLYVSVMIILVNLGVDVLYGYIDPRIRVQ